MDGVALGCSASLEGRGRESWAPASQPMVGSPVAELPLTPAASSPQEGCSQGRALACALVGREQCFARGWKRLWFLVSGLCVCCDAGRLGLGIKAKALEERSYRQHPASLRKTIQEVLQQGVLRCRQAEGAQRTSPCPPQRR